MRNSKCGVLAFVAVLAMTMPAAAQNDADHLTCYKVKDSLKLKGTVDLDTSGLGVSAECKISKAKMFCAPSDAQNASDGVDTFSSAGPRSATERVCYKVKCPTPFPEAQDVTDEFGTRTFEKFKTHMVCSPATRDAPVQQNGFEHRARGLAQLVEGGTSLSPSLHVVSLDGLPPGGAVTGGSAAGDPGGGGVVVVLEAVSSYSVDVRDDLNSLASLRAASLRAGAVLNLRGHSLEESESMFDAMSIDVGTGGVSSTAYFPRLQRVQPSPPRTGVVTCRGAPVGSHTETSSGDPDWTWFSTIWPDRYETSSNATTDEAAFEWDDGCVEVRSPEGAGVALVGDRLVISMDNGSDPRLLKRMVITGGGGLRAFAIRDESTR